MRCGNELEPISCESNTFAFRSERFTLNYKDQGEFMNMSYRKLIAATSNFFLAFFLGLNFSFASEDLAKKYAAEEHGKYVAAKEKCDSLEKIAVTTCNRDKNEGLNKSLKTAETVINAVGLGASTMASCSGISQALGIANAGLAAFRAACSAEQQACEMMCGSGVKAMDTLEGKLKDTKANLENEIRLQEGRKASLEACIQMPECSDEKQILENQVKPALENAKANLTEVEQALTWAQKTEPEIPRYVAKNEKTCDGLKGNLDAAVKDIASFGLSQMQGSKCEQEQANSDMCSRPEYKNSTMCKAPIDCTVAENQDNPTCQLCKNKPTDPACSVAKLTPSGLNPLGNGLGSKASNDPSDDGMAEDSGDSYGLGTGLNSKLGSSSPTGAGRGGGGGGGMGGAGSLNEASSGKPGKKGSSGYNTDTLQGFNAGGSANGMGPSSYADSARRLASLREQNKNKIDNKRAQLNKLGVAEALGPSLFERVTRTITTNRSSLKPE